MVFDPWRQESWDANDTVLIADPSSDADEGEYFQRIPSADYLPTWYGQRSGGQLGVQERDAATKAAAHANTPTVAWFDTLGRTFLTVADNATAGKYATRVELDIEGNQRSVTDALGRKIMTYDYDMLGTNVHQNSADAGERWMLNNVVGKPMRGWDSRDHTVRYVHDALLRPTNLYVQTGNNPEHLVERILYGEGESNDQALNLRTRVFQQCDGAGVITNNQFDFKGNLLKSTRQLLQNYKDEVDWSQSPALETEIFSASTTYDALNRPVTLTTPDASIIRPSYNEANFLEQLNVNLRGAANATPFVTNIDYNAKGQRETVEYGNDARATYDYDPQTFRLTHLKTTRKQDNAVLQDLTYHYDPVGNITSIEDAAQQTIYFKDQVVTPSNDYTYDAMYRLIKATGREHIGQVADPQPEYDWNDSLRVNLPHPNDGNAMRAYIEQYDYDAVGNFLQMIHQAANGNWTRRYAYSLYSQLSTNNRLLSTSLPGDPNKGPYSAKYNYDPHGNMIQMPHLPVMEWDFKDQLHVTQQQVANNAPGERTYYIYDASGQRARKVTQRPNGTKESERIYLGSFEVYREYDSDGTTLERQTLHVMDDKQRIALVETKTINMSNDDSPVQLVRYQFGNHLGSASLELDNQGRVISYEEYTPYGSTSYQAVDQSIKAAAKRYRHTGKERDEETGFTYHGARYYAEWLGRWTSVDPIGISGGLNVYSYVSNKPTVKVDLDGKDEKKKELSFWEKARIVASEAKKAARDRFVASSELVRHPVDTVKATASVIELEYKGNVVMGQSGPSAALHAVDTVLDPLAHAAHHEQVATLADSRGDDDTALRERTQELFSLGDAALLVRAAAKKLPTSASAETGDVPTLRDYKTIARPRNKSSASDETTPIVPPAALTPWTDVQLIERAKSLFQEAAKNYLETKGREATPGAIASLKRELTVGVLQGQRGNTLVTTVAVQDPKFVAFVRPLLRPSEELVDPIIAQRLNNRTGLPNKTGYATGTLGAGARDGRKGSWTNKCESGHL